jgi:autotransporter-associated beta strand protein
LTKVGTGTLTLTGLNTYSGNTTVSAGTLALADNAQLKFVLGATSGSNNSISGAGTVTLDGDFVIDTSAADSLSSGTWTLENVTSLTGAYGASFTVVDFTDAGDNMWTKTLLGKTYTFDETTGILTLTSGGDSTPPTLTSITDNVSGGPVNIGATVTYTVTFDEDMDAASVTAADFANNGTAVASIGVVTETITPGVFTVPVTVTSPGTLVLRINALAVLEDVAGNDLDTDPAILDDTTITVRNAYQTWALTNAISSAPGADKDGDGVNNAIEFLLGGDVGTNDLSKLPKVTMTATNMIITFERKRSSTDGITGCEVEVGTTLTGWPNSYTVGATTAGSDPEVVVTENSPSGFDTITVTVPKGTDPSKFARLEVTVTE